MQLDLLNIEEGVEQNEDFVPGGDFNLDTDIYPMVVDMAYFGESKGGAMNVTARFKEVDGKRTHQEVFYVTSGKAKGQKNTYTAKNGTVRLLPGMESMNQLSVITTGKKISQLTPEEKVVAIYNYEAKKELPTKVAAITEMIGQEVQVAIVRKRENKRVKVGNDYVPSADERVFNEATKFLHTDGHTVAEKLAEDPDTAWKTKWKNDFDTDYMLDKYKPVALGAGVEAASVATAAATAGTIEDMFADD